jgi:3-hydroxyisobutyrate dehydrogenase-like beta-hydroxyacid dehydrogenase
VAERLSPKGVAFADAPVARTREAAQRGELSIMVGADARRSMRASSRCCATWAPMSRTAAACGCGQVVKLVNNALVFENTVAIAEMMVLGERAGVAPAVLLDAVSKGSGDSFALRNHARKAMLPREFPEKVISARVRAQGHRLRARVGAQVGVSAHVTQLAQRYYAATATTAGRALLSGGDRGRGSQYRAAGVASATTHERREPLNVFDCE